MCTAHCIEPVPSCQMTAAVHLPSVLSMALCGMIVCLIVCCDPASALASPSPLKGYHFGSSTATKKVTTSDLNQKKPKSYVPDGLTEEQYMQIKNNELAQQQSMNFGAWGPRFKQVDGDPDSNWFNLPSLWTGGYNANSNVNMNTGSGNDGMERKRGVAIYLRRYGLAYLMLVLSTQLLAKSVSTKKVMAAKWVAARIVVSFAALKPINILASAVGSRWKQLGWLNRNGTTKLAGVFAMLITIVAFVLR